jgi:hypothetical protein
VGEHNARYSILSDNPLPLGEGLSHCVFEEGSILLSPINGLGFIVNGF